MKGYAGRFLRVDLSEGAVTEEPLPRQVAMDFIAGRGFGIKYLYDESPRPTPILWVSTIRSSLPRGARRDRGAELLALAGMHEKPLTGCYARASSGGDFGAWMKFAGYDFILIEGRSPAPVYLHVTRDKAELKGAGEIWGVDTGATQEWLERQHGPATRTACIGPAAEKLVKYSAIVTGRRTASRCGVGTVMGSKKLKAVAITAKRDLILHDPEAFRDLAKEQFRIMKASGDYAYNKSFGTTEGAITRNVLGVYPTRNFRYGQLDGYEQMGPEAYRKLRVADVGCYNCSMRCGKVHVVPDGPYAGARSEGPEYESYWAFSGSIENTSIEATIAADQLCDDLGLDTISAGVTIGFAYELYEKGIITKADTDGLELTYGNHAAMIELIGKIGRREGFGDILAEGSLGAARLIGKGRRLCHAGKGPGARRLRAARTESDGLRLRHVKHRRQPRQRLPRLPGVGYAGAAGGRSLHRRRQSGHRDLQPEQLRPGGRYRLCLRFQLRRLVRPSLSLDAGRGYGHKGICRLEVPQEGRGADRHLDRAFNARDGFDRRHDTLPERFRTEPLHTGRAPGEGEMVRTLDRFLDEYYQLRNWDPERAPNQREAGRTRPWAHRKRPGALFGEWRN